jgi:hypothetical protein
VDSVASLYDPGEDQKKRKWEQLLLKCVAVAANTEDELVPLLPVQHEEGN